MKQECKLCGNIVSDDNFKVIEDVTKSIFDVLLLKLTLDNETQNLMCTVCSSKLLDALNFKSTCAYTDDILFPYINLEDQKPLDLKEIYAKEEKSRSALDDQEVCRLCFKSSSDHKSIQKVPLDDIQIYIPEIKFTATTNPVICMKCHDALSVHSGFIRNCLEVEKKRNAVTIGVKDILLTDSIIKTEEIEIKSDPIDDEMIFEMLCNIRKAQNRKGDTSLRARNGLMNAEATVSLYRLEDLKPTTARSTSSSYESKQRTYETASESRSADRKTQAIESGGSNGKRKRQYSRKNQPKRVTKDLKAKEYNCERCGYNTRDGSNFRRHKLRHKDASETKMYECDRCDYQSVFKRNVNQHQKIHKDPCDVQKYECGECDYKSIRKDYLKKHQLRHKRPSEVQKYERTHQVTHIDPSFEERMYKCHECEYMSNNRGNFMRHQLMHQDRSKVQTYECDECGYKSPRKDKLKCHQLKHKNPSEVRMYECDECEYKSIRKDKLRCHQLRHKDPCDVRMYECDVCDYKSLQKSNLKTHQLKHKHASEVKMYECGECGYKSKYKSGLKKHEVTCANAHTQV